MMESGIDKHWDNLEKGSTPLIIRSFDFEFNLKVMHKFCLSKISNGPSI